VRRPRGQLGLDVVRAEVVEQAAALPEEDRDQVDLQLVEQPGAQALLGGVGAVQQDVLVPGGGLGLATAASIPSVTKVIVAAPRGGSSGGRWVGTKIGTPSWWSPFQPLASSKVRRPTRTAPVAISSSNTSPLTPSGRKLAGSPVPSASQSNHRCPSRPIGCSASSWVR
jgi:hypothetical protein